MGAENEKEAAETVSDVEGTAAHYVKAAEAVATVAEAIVRAAD